MNMIKFSPSRRMFNNPFFENLPANFDDFFTAKEFVPAVNVAETEKEWHIEVSAAGFKKDDFKINLEKDMLTISGEIKTEENKEEKNYTRREFSSNSFSRSFRIKESTVDVEHITAAYENGVLNIVLPKKQVTAANTKEIRIS